MAITTLHNPDLVNKIYQEYLEKIKLYQNTFTTSIPIKYYNINIKASTLKEDLDSTFDYYNLSDIKFDLYELTPCYSVQPINNRSSNLMELEGTMFEGSSNIIIYTIDRPRLNDLITFYSPVNQLEIFRVFNITTPINVLHSVQSPLNFFELDLEYAPLKNLNNIQILNKFVYDGSNEKYLKKEEYLIYISHLEKISKHLNEISKIYSSYKDLYIVNDVVPIEINELLYYIKTNFQQKYKRLFENIKTPYGYLEKYPLHYNNLNKYPFYENRNEYILNYGGYGYDFKTGELRKISWKHEIGFKELYSECNELFLEVLRKIERDNG